MDDLNGLEWTSSSNPPKSSTPAYPSLRPSPVPSSGRSTPGAFRLPTPSTSQPSIRIGSKPSTPANDSFASLLSGSQPKSANKLSLQERQRQLHEEKAKQSQHLDNHFGGRDAPQAPSRPIASPSNGAALLGRTAVPSSQNLSGNTPSAGKQSADDDILAAFNSKVQVDSSSHFPPQQSSSTITELQRSSAFRSTDNGAAEYPDDDPFGLDQFAVRANAPQVSAPAFDDGDILGMLGKPVNEVTALNRREVSLMPQEQSSDEEDVPTNLSDKAAAELVDMGFPRNKAAIALAQTESGHDVMAAVGILLNQAHEESKSRNQAPQDHETRLRTNEKESTHGRAARARDDRSPSWQKPQDDVSRSSSRRQPAAAAPEKDVAKLASDIGNTLFKSANSLWKTSQKKVQRAMAEMQQEGGDSSQPKWMRDAQLIDDNRRNGKSRELQPGRTDVTDEAAMLDFDSGRLNTSTSLPKHHQPRTLPTSEKSSVPSNQRSVSSRDLDVPNSSRSGDSRSASRITREALEKQTPDAYVSPARQRKAPPAREDPRPAVALSKKSPLSSPPIRSNNPFAAVAQNLSKANIAPVVVRPKAPVRQIPSVSSLAIASSTSHRQKGTEAFKRGDFPSAYIAYSNALQPLPQFHPITIVILCNRALTNLKNGDPKAAIADSESALAVIGETRGEGEVIDLGESEGSKDMKDFYGKALMRKAEALENLEKWSDAAKIWRDAVEAGVGGSISIQGRSRCEKSAGGAQRPSNVTITGTRSAGSSRNAQKPSAPVRRPVVRNGASQEAVKRLRQANEAAEKADDEKFALTDQVDAKLLAWKGSKADNLRALLGSMDTVLWPEAGWTKVGMADLIMVNRVKIIYMKAIAKVHPDKIPQNATTEQRMLSGAIFSTLNEAWDKFKQENNL